MKAYTAPTLVISGSAVSETLVGTPFIGLESSNRKPKQAGCVGYYL